MYVKQIYRSSRPEVFCKKGVLGNFVKFTGKHLCQSHFSNNVAGLSPATLLKKRPWHRCLPVNFAKILRTPFSKNTSRRLLLQGGNGRYVQFTIVFILTWGMSYSSKKKGKQQAGVPILKQGVAASILVLRVEEKIFQH